MSSSSYQYQTLLEAVKNSLVNAARYNPGDVVSPAAILWTDADSQWCPVVEQLRPLMPELLTLGEYDPQTRTGPTIWLRCVIEPNVRTEKFPELNWQDKVIPVIYMPKVSRQTLRAVEECPGDLKPLVELQYRGTVWTQKNGKDWTVEAFIVSEDGGLGLDVSRDNQTRQAMLGSLTQLAVTPISRLRGKRLEAEDFDKLMIGDTPRDLLLWLSDPAGVREQWDEAKWIAFCNRCKEEYDFDPEGDGEIVGGEKLGKRENTWYGVWERFAESPALYPGIPELLRRAKPSELIFNPETWPSEAELGENTLRAALLALDSEKPADARKHISELEINHGTRREWVWTQLGMCSLANALAYLTILAKRTDTVLGGDSIEAIAKVYSEGGYLADDAVLQALACVKTVNDIQAVQVAVRSIYLPWLEDTNQNFQKCLASQSLPSATEQKGILAEPGECILFVDGLRFDVGQRLIAMAEERQFESATSWRWAGIPTITATAKPAASPITERLQGLRPGADFNPEITAESQPLTTDRFRKLVTSTGYQVLSASEVGDSNKESARAWTEYGEFDKLGHDLQAKLAERINDQLELLLDRIQNLFEAGWKRVRIITDHGWLLVPGGLPKISLPKYLAESRWARCASIKDSSHVEVPVASWYWNPHERFAFGPGVHCFIDGREYAHGGVSLQECIIPVYTFNASATVTPVTVTVKEIQWLALRCRIEVEPQVEDLVADLRTKPNDPNSSIAEPKSLDAEGKAGLLVAEESLEGTMVSLVILDASGRVICKKATTVGGEE